jgi:hypothetical protein
MSDRELGDIVQFSLYHAFRRFSYSFIVDNDRARSGHTLTDPVVFPLFARFPPTPGPA